jgi:hypothetical protein
MPTGRQASRQTDKHDKPNTCIEHVPKKKKKITTNAV